MWSSKPSSLAAHRAAGLLVALVLVLVLAGCQSSGPKHDPAYAPARPSATPAPARRDGAIYYAGWDMRLFEDQRARRIGDILTVQLIENTDASKNTSTATAKDSNLNIANPTILGTTPLFNLPGRLPLASTTDNTLAVSGNSSQEFTGAGSTAQSNSLTGNVSVTVVEVLPNGNLVVRGEKLLNLNRGQEHIRLSGIVRVEDISANNTVPSTRVADVVIDYGGDGEVADAATAGWLARFFLSMLWPF